MRMSVTQDSFELMRKLDDRVKQILDKEQAFMLGFWNEELDCFGINPKLDLNNPSVTSTCLGISCILESPEKWSSVCQWEPGVDTKISLKAAVDQLRQRVPENSQDPFRFPMMISTVYRLLSVSELTHPSRGSVKSDLSALLSQRSRLSQHRFQRSSSYLRNLNARALLEMLKSGAVPRESAQAGELLFALDRVAMVAFDEVRPYSPNFFFNFFSAYERRIPHSLLRAPGTRCVVKWLSMCLPTRRISIAPN
jgi:hypothetical protein